METGRGVLIQALEGLTIGPSAPSKILVMQAPGSAALGSLQDILSLPPCPTAAASASGALHAFKAPLHAAVLL